jgi:histidinol-phosphatase
MSAHAEDLALAQRLADEAARISLARFKTELQSWSKADGSLATEADLAVEDALRASLASARPDDAMLGEERGESGRGARRWILDAIDGTVEFAARSPNWSTLIALEVDGRVVVGVCDQPAHGRRYWAVRGGGAFCADASTPAGRRLRVNGMRDLATARSYLPPPRWRPDARAHAIAERIAGATRPESPVTHPALQVASGGYEVAVFLSCGPWDIAAPALVVEEAGGRFSDLAGRHSLTSGCAMYSNGAVHDEVLRHVAEVLQSAEPRAGV